MPEMKAARRKTATLDDVAVALGADAYTNLIPRRRPGCRAA